MIKAKQNMKELKPTEVQNSHVSEKFFSHVLKTMIPMPRRQYLLQLYPEIHS